MFTRRLTVRVLPLCRKLFKGETPDPCLIYNQRSNSRLCSTLQMRSVLTI